MDIMKEYCKAKKTGFVLYGKYSDTVEYEYRGHTYEVEFAKDWSYCCTPAHIQHQSEQAKIDRMIETEQKSKEVRCEDTAEYAFNLFWEYVNAE